MATLALAIGGQFVGGLVGGPIGATVGRALGALAGSAIDGMLFGEPERRSVRRTAQSDVRLTGSSEGIGVPKLFGWSRLSGNIIWATELEVVTTVTGGGGGGKGFAAPSQPVETEDELIVSFAIGLCEGEVLRMGRIWADGQLLDTEGLTMRFYSGSDTQPVDGLISAKQGAGNAPAYRGLCYIVFERLALKRFGNRIPAISVELCRVVGALERDLRAVTVIPGATEYGYDPTPRLRLVSPGVSVSENVHAEPGVSDFTVSIDELTALCPNLEAVALVVCWFGDDLRCAECQIGPRTEGTSRVIAVSEWLVAGLGRGDVPVVSSHDGGPAYGGTPSDHAVLAAIADLKARGLRVTLYPMILMDIPAGNTLPDPYWGGTGQPSYPWRGRITCDPAPGQVGSPDGTEDIGAQVAAFIGQGYRAMHLHYAAIAATAEADALIIGSEMRGLTTLNDGAGSFPMVDGLVTLAADVRAIVGPDVKLTYAADWSEYAGWQGGGGGEKYFHLDPLWADDNIDAIGIDNYMPVADWRDGTAHLDADAAGSIYDVAYLRANIAGGEGFDWYYSSDADRQAQLRAPISDGAHDEPFVWRFKDLVGFWSNPHYDRPGGVRATEPTAWVPGSKPVWFTEVGCGAVDKGANQPNVFGDAKSSEDGRPYFSTGAPDALMQRQVLRAHLDHWADPATNPEGMVDIHNIYAWTWDARPYPAFPGRRDVWADGVNHATGHWLTGRLGQTSADELAVAVAAEFGIELEVEGAAGPMVSGYVVDGPATAREALEPVLEAAGLDIAVRGGGLSLVSELAAPRATIGHDQLVAEDKPVLSRRRPDPGEQPDRLVLGFLDRERDYLSGTVTALRPDGRGLVASTSALTLDPHAARVAAETMLTRRDGANDEVTFGLSEADAALEPGDVVTLADVGQVRITAIRDARHREVTGRRRSARGAVASEMTRPRPPEPVLGIGRPDVVLAHLPGTPDDPLRSRLVIGAFAEPWPGDVVIDGPDGVTLARLTRPAGIGVLAEDFPAGPVESWDETSELVVDLSWGHPVGDGDAAALEGRRAVAVETDAGGWEVVGFAEAELVAPQRYRLTRLRRGIGGSIAAVGEAAAGRRCMVLDARVMQVPVPDAWLGTTRTLLVYGGPRDFDGVAVDVVLGVGAMLPLPVADLMAERIAGDIAISWRRRSRADTGASVHLTLPLDYAPEAYTVAIYDGETLVRTLQSTVPEAVYTAGQQVADFGGPATDIRIVVSQLSAVYGAGHTSEVMFDD
jgi:hypothetical protein